jgi:transposase
VDADGDLVARQRIGDDAAGLKQLLDMLALAGDSPDSPVPVAIETSRGLLVACLRANGRPMFVINPPAVSRYRERHSVSRKKSDHADAMVLANILRTDMPMHRPIPTDSDLVQAIAVLARAWQDAVWDRTQAHNKLRSLLREYDPAFLAAFRDTRGGVMRSEARAILAAAPTPGAAADLSVEQIVNLLCQAGRQRRLMAKYTRLRQVLTAEQLHQPPPVEGPWAVRRRRCCGHSIPPASTPTSSPRPLKRLLISTGTPRSLPACPVLEDSPVPGCSPR